MARLFANWDVFSASSGRRKIAEASDLPRKRDKSAGTAMDALAMLAPACLATVGSVT